MKAFRTIDLIVVSLFVIGLLAGFLQPIQTEITAENIVAEVNPQFAGTLKPIHR